MQQRVAVVILLVTSLVMALAGIVFAAIASHGAVPRGPHLTGQLRAALEAAAAGRNQCMPSSPPYPGEASPIELGTDHCAVSLPPLAPLPPAELLKRAEKLLEAEDSPFPFTSEAGYNISAEGATEVDRSVRARVNAGEKMPLCLPSTYDGHGVSYLAELFLPGGAGTLNAGDAVVDMGAGIAKVLAVVALVSNASARGIELSPERFKIGCDVLRLLERMFNTDPQLAARSPPTSSNNTGLTAEVCEPTRFLELWRGDMLEPPSAALRPPGDGHGSLTFFAYANCLPYQLLSDVMRLVAATAHPCIRLLSTKTPISTEKLQHGLRWIRGGAGIYTLFKRDGDSCRAAAEGQRIQL